MLQLCLEFYFLQTDTAWEEHVHELAIGGSWKTTVRGRDESSCTRMWWRSWLAPWYTAAPPAYMSPLSLHVHLLNNRGWVPGGREPTTTVHHAGSLCIQFSAPTVDFSTNAGESTVRLLLLLSEERDTTLPFYLASVLLPVIKINLRKSTGHVTMREVHRFSGDVWPKDIRSCCFTAILGSNRAGNGYH